MAFNLTILYPNNGDITFDFDYYINTHIPKAVSNWADLGLVNWQVIKFGPGADGSKPSYQVGCILTWKDQEALKAASAGPAAKEGLGSLSNYTNQPPTFLAGGIVTSSG